MNGSFCVPCLYNNRVDAAFRDVYGKIIGFLPVPTINRGSVRRFDLHVQRALHCFKSDLQGIAPMQFQRMQIRSVQPLDVQQIGVRILTRLPVKPSWL